MKYRKFGKTDLKISALGFGCMRLPTTTNAAGHHVVDTPVAVSLLRHAIEKGVNYFDTAYGYHGGESEVVTGLALRDGYRERVHLATKFPCWEFKKKGDFERILKVQLKRLQTDYLDCYMLHALGRDSFQKIAVESGVLDRLIAAKKAGVVRHIGFSFHDGVETFKRIVDHTDAWDFCQIQYNYMDTTNQAGTEGLRYAAAKGLAVIVMEPLLGGKLADKMPDDVKTVFDGSGKTNTEMALDFIWNQPEASFLLSGMGTKKMVDENVKYANRSKVGMLTLD
ncbi:MAG: aldo/keto reductase, partial [Kiritimatiellaeota bacterium]|nr:aldo/keto reductase [Kiritimatiellota bacterium]